MKKIYYIYTLFFLLITAKSNFLNNYDVVWGVFIASLILLGIYNLRFYKRDLIIIGTFSLIYLGFVFSRHLVINNFPKEFLISDIFFLFKYLMLSFVYCAYMKEELMNYLIKVFTHLAILSLGFYVIQLAGGAGLLANIGRTVQGILPYYEHPAEYTNFLLYTFDYLHQYRNSGFAWEPGVFGSFAVIILMLHFFKNDFQYDRTAWILTFAILTTISTTAYLAFMVLLFMFYRVRGGKVNAAFVLILILAMTGAAYIPFMSEKIKETYEQDMAFLKDQDEFAFAVEYYDEYDDYMRLNRFASMAFIIDNFGNKLWVGVSNGYSKMTSEKYGVDLERVYLSNGLIDFCAKFGLVGLVFVFFRYAKTLRIYLPTSETVFYGLMVFFVVHFGETIIALPFCLIFIFTADYLGKEETKILENAA
ncbi:O-antigen ligase family protein [Pararhodonellum marinum]|uniref:O-antigen ligase family protein n=1 Tax=Pararhodonellum marinum TaxID=2755358 RepID=UPI00188DF2F4|nr:O-antigen ligase family protein [Pararhodonellum marinum]